MGLADVVPRNGPQTVARYGRGRELRGSFIFCIPDQGVRR